MAPKIALPTISSVTLAAVDTPRGMQTQHTKSHGQNRWDSLGAALATPHKHAVVFLSMRPRADGAPALGGMTCASGMTPPPASLAEGRPGIGPGSPEGTHKLANLNHPTEKGLSP